MSETDAEVDMTWRKLALQFDAHRIEALSTLRYAVSSIEEYATVRDILREPLGTIKAFLSAPPLSGDKVLADRLATLVRPLPLEWGNYGEAKGAFAKYSVYECGDGGWNSVCYPYEESHFRLAEGVSEADAKAAAYAHHSAAILSALEAPNA